jgi:hypothetical protein
MSLKEIMLEGELSSKRCRFLARHKDLLEFIDYLLKEEKLDIEIGKAIATEIHVHGERETWANIFDYGVKGKDLFAEVF